MYLLPQNIREKSIKFYFQRSSVFNIFLGLASFGPIDTHAKFFEVELVRNLALSSMQLGAGVVLVHI